MKPVEDKQKLIEEIKEELNKVRKNPLCYVPILEEYLKYFEGNILHKPWESVPIETSEGPNAVKEAILMLKAQTPLLDLKFDYELSKAAQDHANDLGSSGSCSHIGSDNSYADDRITKYLTYESSISENLDFGNTTAQDLIFSLIVDDGVDRENQRSSIFANNLNFVGIGVSDHLYFGTCVVLKFVGKIISYKKEKALAKIKTPKTPKNLKFPKTENPVDNNNSATSNLVNNEPIQEEKENDVITENADEKFQLELENIPQEDINIIDELSNEQKENKTLDKLIIPDVFTKEEKNESEELPTKEIEEKSDLDHEEKNMIDKEIIPDESAHKQNENNPIMETENFIDKNITDEVVNKIDVDAPEGAISAKFRRVTRKRDGRVIQKKLYKTFTLETGNEIVIEIDEI